MWRVIDGKWLENGVHEFITWCSCLVVIFNTLPGALYKNSNVGLCWLMLAVLVSCLQFPWLAVATYKSLSFPQIYFDGVTMLNSLLYVSHHSWCTTYDDLLSTSERFPQPIPLPVRSRKQKLVCSMDNLCCELMNCKILAGDGWFFGRHMAWRRALRLAGTLAC